MTVNELIIELQKVPEDQRDMKAIIKTNEDTGNLIKSVFVSSAWDSEKYEMTKYLIIEKYDTD